MMSPKRKRRRICGACHYPDMRVPLILASLVEYPGVEASSRDIHPNRIS